MLRMIECWKGEDHKWVQVQVSAEELTFTGAKSAPWVLGPSRCSDLCLIGASSNLFRLPRRATRAYSVRRYNDLVRSSVGCLFFDSHFHIEHTLACRRIEGTQLVLIGRDVIRATRRKWVAWTRKKWGSLEDAQRGFFDARKVFGESAAVRSCAAMNESLVPHKPVFATLELCKAQTDKVVGRGWNGPIALYLPDQYMTPLKQDMLDDTSRRSTSYARADEFSFFMLYPCQPIPLNISFSFSTCSSIRTMSQKLSSFLAVWLGGLLHC